MRDGSFVMTLFCYFIVPIYTDVKMTVMMLFVLNRYPRPSEYKMKASESARYWF